MPGILNGAFNGFGPPTVWLRSSSRLARLFWNREGGQVYPGGRGFRDLRPSDSGDDARSGNLSFMGAGGEERGREPK